MRPDHYSSGVSTVTVTSPTGKEIISSAGEEYNVDLTTEDYSLPAESEQEVFSVIVGGEGIVFLVNELDQTVHYTVPSGGVIIGRYKTILMEGTTATELVAITL